MPSSPLRLLRPAEQDDMAVLLRLLRAFYAQFGYPYSEPEKRRLVSHLLATPALGSLLLVLSAAGDPVGYLFLSSYYSLEFGGETAFIDEFYIEPGHRGHGLGSRVLLEIIESARARGLHALQLEAERTNPRAAALYAKLGFVDHDRHLLTRAL